MTHYNTSTDPIYKILNCLACPECQTSLIWQEGLLICDFCGTPYPITDGIADLRLPKHREKNQMNEWSKHWSEIHQKNYTQRFFSFYRKAVFARTVRYYIDRFFAVNGIFVEAGSGTSETSMKIDKHRDARALVALDIVLPVLYMTHSVMDVRVCGDVFHLPFRKATVDGIWNVGVMEHFTHNQIDQIMREFHRVLKKNGRVILLWPGVDSAPQKLLYLIEKIINSKKRQEKFRFHLMPSEVSQLRSKQEGSEVLGRNGFQPLLVDRGFRSLMAFKILVGEKR